MFHYIFATPMPELDSVPWVASLSEFPIFFGIAIFAIEGICVVRMDYDMNSRILKTNCIHFQVLPIENQMKHPEDLLGWNGVINTSMAMVVILYIVFGFFGYLKYGLRIESSISLNLPIENT